MRVGELRSWEKDCQGMKVLCDRLHRLHRLYSDDLEEAARWNLEFFGKLSRPYLTPLEEKLLGFLDELNTRL